MSINILENSNLKEYINPNFDAFNSNNLIINGSTLLQQQSYTATTSNLTFIDYATPISDIYYEILGTHAVRISGAVDFRASFSTPSFSFEISLPSGVVYTAGNKAYGVSYAKRAGDTRSAGLSSQPSITLSNTLLLEYVRGINFSNGNTGRVYFDLYIEL